MARTFYEGHKPPTSVFLTGTGIVENSWQPVTKALERYFPQLPDGEENLAFATEIYRLRQIASAYQGGLRLAGLKHFKDLFNIRSAFVQSLECYYNLKKEIADNLTFAMDERRITLRQVISKIYIKWLNDSDNHVVMTTNWDLLSEAFFDDYFVYHLHGDIKDYKTLYLPSEHSGESYHHIKAKGKVPNHNKRITHGNWLATGIDRLIISGLSLSPLDAELNSLLRSAIDKGPIPEVIIIDPLPEQVYKRLRFHTMDKISKIDLLKPEDL